VTGAPKHVVDLLGARLQDVRTANSEYRGRTGPLSLNSSGELDLLPVRDADGSIAAYDKPLMVLIDEFSASAADFFPAVIQDNNRGILFGWRTMGAGGSVLTLDATSYTEGVASVTASLMNRKNPIATGEYPTAPYVENIGVRPDIEVDYMTRENLMLEGQPFVEAFTAAMVNHIRGVSAAQRSRRGTEERTSRDPRERQYNPRPISLH